jgi:hypothetical protein
MSRPTVPNLLTKYTPRGVINQVRPLKRLLDEWGWNRPAMAYITENKMMMTYLFVIHIQVALQLHYIKNPKLPSKGSTRPSNLSQLRIQQM